MPSCIVRAVPTGTGTVSVGGRAVAFRSDGREN